MIKIRHSKIKDNTPYCMIHAQGHACYDERGKDIVCAGVSTLMFTLAAAAAELADGEKINVSTELQPGDMSVVICGAGAAELPQFEQVYDTVLCGLRLLSVKYPEYIQLSDVT